MMADNEQSSPETKTLTAQCYCKVSKPSPLIAQTSTTTWTDYDERQFTTRWKCQSRSSLLGCTCATVASAARRSTP